MMVAIMFVERIHSKGGAHCQVLLRESFRTPGEVRSKVKHRTLLNLTRFDPEVVTAIEFGLKHKREIAQLEKVAPGAVRRRQGKSAGAVWLLYRVAQRVGMTSALGTSREALLALWLVFARLIDQGSRLSAVRLAQEHAACELLGLSDFCEDDLYDALGWLDRNQVRIEKALFAARHGEQKPRLFLYDVTSSYLEGTENAYARFGYNRDGKKGKMQIVIGLLTDEDGSPVTVEVFEGNTQDPQTLVSQIRKVGARFGCERVTIVGDRGMIKSVQIAQLTEADFYYITAITKPQICRMLRQGILQMNLFDERVYEVEHETERFVLRRNPVRAAEMEASRDDKLAALTRFADGKTRYLAEHPRASAAVAERKVKAKGRQLKITDWALPEADGSSFRIRIDEKARAGASRLDGCYVIKTNLPPDAIDAQTVHDRYKDLAQVEQGFRTMKTGHLEIRPIFVRTAQHTRGHVLSVMLAYLLRRELDAAWRNFDLTVEEGIESLTTLCADEVSIADQKRPYLEVPEPRESVARLLDACHVPFPTVLPARSARVATRRKLQERRKP